MRKGQKMTEEQKQNLRHAHLHKGINAQMIICDCPEMHVIEKDTECQFYKKVMVWDLK